MSNNGHKPTLSPELRSWIDNVVAPALVREFLARLDREHIACNGVEGSAESGAESTATIEAEGGMT